MIEVFRMSNCGQSRCRWGPCLAEAAGAAMPIIGRPEARAVTAPVSRPHPDPIRPAPVSTAGTVPGSRLQSRAGAAAADGERVSRQRSRVTVRASVPRTDAGLFVFLQKYERSGADGEWGRCFARGPVSTARQKWAAVRSIGPSAVTLQPSTFTFQPSPFDRQPTAIVRPQFWQGATPALARSIMRICLTHPCSKRLRRPPIRLF